MRATKKDSFVSWLPRILATSVASCAAMGSAQASIDVGGRTIEVVDMHLHPGHFATMAPAGKTFIVDAIPEFVRPYAPALIEHQLDPWGEWVGIRGQADMAGVDHVVLYAVYTHHTSGYFTNRELESVLLDSRNGDGADAWAWGLASINLDDIEDETMFSNRLEALASYFDLHPGRFVGIKLAHAHQGIAFDDARMLRVYDVAATAGVPVLLHTGFSPFPNSETEPEYYDPSYLDSVVTAYDGTRGAPRVDFVLSHVGQGDLRAVAGALNLAETHDNVWLEISALSRPPSRDENGDPIDSNEPQLPLVLAQIQQRNLAARTLFGSDGPQFSGYVRDYLNLAVAGMQDAGFSIDAIEDVLSGNFYRLFLTS